MDLFSKKTNNQTTETATQEPELSKDKNQEKLNRINKLQDNSKQFNEDAGKTVVIKPNVPKTVLFFEDWYVTWQELYNEQIAFGKEPTAAAAYAEEHYRFKQQMIPSTQNPGQEFPKTTFRVVEPNSKFANLTKDLNFSPGKANNKAIADITDILKKNTVEHDKRTIMTICKEVGSTQYDVSWKIEAKAY
jgi:hypothetical protein